MANKYFTDKQRIFIAEYLIDFNATRSAIAAGYSAKTADVQGSRLLANVKVAAEIERRIEKRQQKLEITEEKVLRELALMGFARMDSYITIQKDGSACVNLAKVQEDPQLAAAIQEITVEEYADGRGEDAREVKRVKFKLADKRGSLELLGKKLKLWTDRAEVKIDDLDKMLAAIGQLNDEQLAKFSAKLSGQTVVANGHSGGTAAETRKN